MNSRSASSTSSPERRLAGPRTLSGLLAATAWLLAPGLTGCTDGVADRGAAPPVVGGLHGPGGATLTPRVRGLVLLGELGCVACHRAADATPPIEARRGPDLAAVGQRVRPGHLLRFLADPLASVPGTTMPDVLRGHEPAAPAATALTHYLRSFGEPAGAAAAATIDEAAAFRGRHLFHSVGCVACHAPRDGEDREVALPGSVSLAHLTDKYRLESLRTFLLAPHDARPSRRMPTLDLAPAEAHELACYLLSSGATTDAPAAHAAQPAPPVDAEQAAIGRTLFGQRGCAACHELPDPQRQDSTTAAALRELDPARGCLSGRAGGWPFYALTEDQRGDLRAALASLGEPLGDEARIRQLLATRNCTACHARDTAGELAEERSQFFKSEDPTLGPESRLPPTLAGVGSKLQAGWLVDTIAHGQQVRPYMRTRMPGFGAAVAEELSALLAAVDALPPLEVAALPADRGAARDVTELGRELVGEQGMNCISCHRFAGEQAGVMGAVDLVESTGRRLRPEWFAHFLRAPFRFKPGTLMPQFFPDGGSVRPNLGDGSAARQIEALWHYLAEGRNVRKPPGLRRPPIELTVADEAVILRRSVQHTGKRGISVGYPLGVNLTFDAERLGLNQIWWGRFLDAAPVWSGQGSGEARILGQQRVALPNGPAIVELPAEDAPWPEASRRELGQRFRGYDLDAAQRPSFRYVCADVEVTDKPAELATTGGDSRPLLRRTLRLVGTTDKTLHFRAARAARIEDLGEGLVQVGDTLRLHLGDAAFRIRPAGDEQELLVALPLRGGEAELSLDYEWCKEDR